MAFTIPGSWTAPEPIKFAPIGAGRLRRIIADTVSGGPEAVTQLTKAVNYAIATHRQREVAHVWASDLSWTDTAYDANNEIDWPQPFSNGLTSVDYRFRCQVSGGNGDTGEIRVQGADGAWKTGTVTNAGWQNVTITGVDLSSAGDVEYFTPVLQGKVDNAGDQLDIRCMGWREQPLSTVTAGGVGHSTAKAFGADDAVTFDPDAPLSADAVQELTRALLWLFDERCRTLHVKILPDGSGVHPDDTWSSSTTTHPDPADSDSAANIFDRLIAAPDWDVVRDLTILIEAKSNGAVTGGVQVADRHGNTAVKTWTAGESTYSVKSLALTDILPTRGEGVGDIGTELFLSIIDNLTVRKFVVFATDTSFSF